MHTGYLAHLFGPQFSVKNLWMPFLILQQSARINIRIIIQITDIIDIIVKLSIIKLVLSRWFMTNRLLIM